MSVTHQATVVIPTYNRCEQLLNCLTALDRQTMPTGSFDVVVVDDGSQDDTVEKLGGLLPTHYGLRVVTQKNSGPAAARNTGIREAGAPIVVFFDDDCQPHPDCVKKLVETLSTADKKLAGCGGVVVRQNDNLVGRYVDRIGVLCPPVNQGQVLYLVTCNAAFRRSVLNDVGGFCEEFVVAGGEDPDLCVQINLLGYELAVQDQAVVTHAHPDSLSALFRMYTRYGKGLVVACKLGRHTPTIPVPYPAYNFVRHLRWPDTSLSDSVGFLLCETVKVAAMGFERFKARFFRSKSC